MKRFTYQSRIDAPLEAVAAFHQNSQVLRLLTPPPVFVRFHEVQPLNEGSIADFTLWFGPLPIRWVAIHSQVDRLNGFTDYQARGPFDHWVHRHYFSAVDENTTMISDQIQASLKRHPFWWIFGQLLWLSLPFLFAYRGQAVRKNLAIQNNRKPNSLDQFAGENRISTLTPTSERFIQ